MPMMQPPTDLPVYWQLRSVEHTPELRPKGGYDVAYSTEGFDLDLDDGLMAESLLAAEDAAQGITLTILGRDGQTAMEHRYSWTPLPIYLEPDTTYPVEVTGTVVTGEASPNSLLGIYVQGEIVSRISAGAYTNHPTSTTLEVNTDSGIYKDGSLVISMVLRDVNDMFRDRIVYTYAMNDGVKPVPTPIPGFVAEEELAEGALPEFYVPVEGADGLWRIITAPEEYRAYGYMNGEGPFFFPSDAQGNVVMNERVAEAEEDFAAHVEGFVAEEPETLPDTYVAQGDGRFAFITRDGETIVRGYGRIDGKEPAFYALTEAGEVAANATPVDPAADFEEHIKGFGAAEALEAVEHYEEIGDGLYSFKGRDGETYYRSYGRLNGEEPAWYPADATGQVVEAAAAADPAADFEDYVKGFDATELPELPKHYEAIGENLYAVEDQDGELLYRVYGVKDGQEPAFYPADAEGNVAEDAQPVKPEDDFETYVAGFEPEALAEVPEYYETTQVPDVYSFVDKEGITQYRAYGKLHRGDAAFYPADEEGSVSYDALPIQPASDLASMPPPPFNAETPSEVPAYYEQVEGKENVYSITGLTGETDYRAYGAYGNGAAQFYPADEQGEPVENADPVSPQKDYAERFAAFEPQIPAEEVEIPETYEAVEDIPGLYQFENASYEPEYRVYSVTEEGEPAFYPADAQGNILSGVPADPEADKAQTPQPVSYMVVTLAPSPETSTTSIARVDRGDSRWRDPSAPAPTAYVAAVVDQEDASVTTITGATAVARLVPTETTGAEPTEYVAAVAQQSVAPSQSNAVVASHVTNGASAETSGENGGNTAEETGATETAAVETTAETAQDATEEPADNNGGDTGETPAEQKPKAPWWIALIVAGVAAVGGGGYYLSKRKKSE